MTTGNETPLPAWDDNSFPGKIDFEREYQNVPPHPESANCDRCGYTGGTSVHRTYESTREPNKSHPEWFHVTVVPLGVDITPRKGFERFAVQTIYICCGNCGKVFEAF